MAGSVERGEMTPESAGIATEDGRSSRWFSSSSFWTGPFLVLMTIFVMVVIGVLWYVLGGLPGDHDEYGAVAVPGQQVIELPEGDVRLNFESGVTGSGDSRSVQDQPEGLEVRVSAAEGGEQIEVEDVPSWLFSSTGDTRGHEPLGEIDVPSEGPYRVQAIAEGAGGFAAPAATRDAPGTDSGPEVTVGAKPWNPLGTPLAGALIAAFAAGLATFLLTLPIRLISS